MTPEEEAAMLAGGSGGLPGMINQSAAPAKGPLTPQQELARMMIKQAPFGQQERNLDQQMAMADELRRTATPGMRGSARVMTAANPLEHIGAVGSRLAGDYQRGQVMGKQDALFDKRMGALGMKKDPMTGEWIDQ